MKILKLKHMNHVNCMHKQKAIDHLNTKHSKLSKSPKFSKLENSKKIYDLSMNECNLIKKKG